MKLFNFFDGRKAGILSLFVGFPLWLVLVWSYVIKDWNFAKFFAPIALTGILAYLGVNVFSHVKGNGKNNGKT